MVEFPIATLLWENLDPIEITILSKEYLNINNYKPNYASMKIISHRNDTHRLYCV